MTVGLIKRAKGRPRDPAKRAALVDAARELFLRLGADAVTVDQVIAAAKVSRATYYSNFGDRQQLLAAVIARESERIVSDEAADTYEAADVREALSSFGDGLMRFLADPDSMRLEPLILHVRQHQPDLATSFFTAGPRRVWDILERIIVAGQSRGQLGDVDPASAVNDLIGLWQGCWRTELMYGQRRVPDARELRQRSRPRPAGARPGRGHDGRPGRPATAARLSPGARHPASRRDRARAWHWAGAGPA